MILDQTLQKIIDQILLEIKDKYGIDSSTEEIFEIINTQIEATKLGFKNSITVHWSRFCKFVYTRRGERKSEVIKFKHKLKDLEEDLSLNEIEGLTNNFIKDNAKEKKNYIANSDGRRTIVTLDEVESKIKENNALKTFKRLM